ncbi:MAG: 1,4-dihydroxy-6-naphthoate synthase [Bacteroidales bacterium]|nr:1,4-dihydroxy-6-naphthoate synthase [Bacteroidales bacterium]
MKNNKLLTIGFSPCPNDTFIFDGLINGKSESYGLSFEPVIADVEELNRMSVNGILDVTKLSFHAFLYVSSFYKILDCGAALGKNNGPLLISKKKIYPDEVGNLKIAVPGKKTTASLLLSIAYPEKLNTKEYLFSDIEEVVLSGEADAGLIIHETRFTYQLKGLKKILDLGEFWEKQYNLPLPLGGIMISRRVDESTSKLFYKALNNSILFAFENPLSSINYIKSMAQEMDEKVIRNHINLYVNNYTKNLGLEGKNAIETLFKVAVEKGITPKPEEENWWA